MPEKRNVSRMTRPASKASDLSSQQESPVLSQRAPPSAVKALSSKQRPKLQRGERVKTMKYSFEVRSLLGSGGFGDVYKVLRTNGGTRAHFAMKTEGMGLRPEQERLKLEARILREMSSIKKPEDKKHFVEYIDKGRTQTYKFLVMTLVGDSLHSLRKDRYNNHLEASSVIRIALQTLDSIRDLHAIGFIHRDIKPHNFAIGRTTKNSTIFMLDFGIVHKFIDRDGKLKPPRQKTRFIGTVRYAPRSCHQQREQSRADDIESWLFMIYEFFDNDNLAWRRVTDRENVVQLKQMFMENNPVVLAKEVAPSDLRRIVRYVDNLTYEQEPDYPHIRQIVLDAAKKNKLRTDTPFEWEQEESQLCETVSTGTNEGVQKESLIARVKKVRQKKKNSKGSKGSQGSEEDENRKESVVRKVTSQKKKKSSSSGSKQFC